MKYYRVVKDPNFSGAFNVQTKDWIFGKWETVCDTTPGAHSRRFHAAKAAQTWAAVHFSIPRKLVKIKDYSAFELRKMRKKESEKQMRNILKTY